MSTYAEGVRETFRILETEEICKRLKAGTLTAEAHAIALEELASRGAADVLQQPDTATVVGPAPGFFARCWSGKERLWKAFWLLGLVMAFLSSPLKAIANSPFGLTLYLAVALPAQVFHLVSVWRCAFRTSHWVWSVAARIWVVLGVVVTIAVLIAALGSVRM
jgi:hypothetical protein